MTPQPPSSEAPAAHPRRVLLKLSGEVFGGGAVGLDPDVVSDAARQIAEAVATGVQVAVVVGGGNFFRGAELSQSGMARDRADYMGMLGTVMNALALQDFIEKAGVPARVQSAIAMTQVAEPYIPLRAIRHLEKGRVVICAAGTGNPFFTTDSAASLRAIELEVDAMFKATKVDGVYSKDPKRFDDAVKYDALSYRQVLTENLNVMDATSVVMCRDNDMPMVVFDMTKPDEIVRAVFDDGVGTVIHA